MRTQQSGSTNEPISIDGEFFKRLKTLIKEIREVALAEVAESQKLPIALVRDIDVGEIPEALPTSNATKDLPDDIREEYEEIDKRYTVERVQAALESSANVSLNLDYSNGYTFQTNDLDQLLDILENEPDSPAELTVTVGGWANSRLRLALGGKFQTVARYTVDGPRRDVDHIVTMVRNLLRASEPEIAWLHGDWPAVALRLVVTAAFIASYAYLVTKISPPKSEWLGVLWLGVMFGAVGAAVGAIPAGQLKRAFPRCQFEFGADRKRRRSTRALIWATLTVLAVPALIAWFFASR